MVSCSQNGLLFPLRAMGSTLGHPDDTKPSHRRRHSSAAFRRLGTHAAGDPRGCGRRERHALRGLRPVGGPAHLASGGDHPDTGGLNGCLDRIPRAGTSATGPGCGRIDGFGCVRMWVQLMTTWKRSGPRQSCQSPVRFDPSAALHARLRAPVPSQDSLGAHLPTHPRLPARACSTRSPEPPFKCAQRSLSGILRQPERESTERRGRCQSRSSARSSMAITRILGSSAHIPGAWGLAEALGAQTQ
jgi:hypothetical protein